MDDAGSKTLKTGGFYCEGDVTVNYTPRVDDSFRHWDVSVSGTIRSNYTNILQDDWLKQHRSDENLCVALIPKFALKPESEKGPHGIFLFTNRIVMETSTGSTYKGLAASVHSNGGSNCRLRTAGLTNGSGTGDINITTEGLLRAVSTNSSPLVPGEYCVIACLM